MTAQSRLVYFNGKLVPETEAKISIYDSALMFGDMVFEMTRSFNKKQFKLREHIDRLYAGVKILRIPVTMTPEEMERACEETIEANDHLFAADDEHRLMIDVSRGLLGIYQGIDGLHKGENVIIADFPLRWTVAGMGELFDTGINAVISSQRAIPATLLDPKVKNRSRIHYLMANIEAGQIEGNNNWALLLDPDGFVAEGTGDNFFIVKDGVVITPEGRNILRGVSRHHIIHELCPQLGIPCVEKNIEPYDVNVADEAFMTGTPFCMLPVTSLNGLPIGSGEVGPLFKRLLCKWGDNLGVSIEGQIKKWDAERGAGSGWPRTNTVSVQDEEEVTDRIGFMQGRLSPMVGGRIQAFPWEHWRDEFPTAERLGFGVMEWTLDQERLHENPLLTSEGQAEIRALSARHGVTIPSLTGDCFMQAPFWRVDGAERAALIDDFRRVAEACVAVGTSTIVVPLVDNGRLENRAHEDAIVQHLETLSDFLTRHGLHIAFESDYAPAELARFINRFDPAVFGVNYDMGNSAAAGRDVDDEVGKYGHRITNVHVKDRVLGGTTVPLGTGNTDFQRTFAALGRSRFTGIYILQTARAADGDHGGALIRYRDMTVEWLSRYGS